MDGHEMCLSHVSLFNDKIISTKASRKMFNNNNIDIINFIIIKLLRKAFNYKLAQTILNRE